MAVVSAIMSAWSVVRALFCSCAKITDEPEDPYYTLEIEPDGTVRQKRTLFDRQHEDIEQATDFLRRWQKVVQSVLQVVI